jgi:small subunit ribosomal protein S1
MSDTPVPGSEETVPTGDSSFADVLSEFESHRARPPAGALEGIVLSIGDQSVFVDIGRKNEGILPAEQVRDRSGNVKVKPGDALAVTVTGRDQDGYYLLTTAKVVLPRDWSALEKAFAEKAVISGTVEEVVKGGLRVDVGVRAFLPASRSGARDAAEMEALIGQAIRCRITKLDVADEDVVVDRRAVLEQEEQQARAERFAALKEGDTVTGAVRSLTDFGAFVDLGGVDGLLHVAEMAWRRVAKPDEVVSPGDQITVRIARIDPQTRKISLSLRQLQADPWTGVAERYPAGSRVKAKIVRVADFGAFAALEPGVEGLIHVSEMSWSKGRKAADVVKPGEMVEVVVLDVNAADRKLRLGLKQALGDPWEQAANRYAPGVVVEAPVISLAKFGAFVEIEEGVEGMIHVADIASDKRLHHPNEALKEGQKVRAVVLGLDQERRRVRLGMKQLEPTDADEYIGEHKAGDLVSGRIVEIGGGSAKVELGMGVFARCRLEGKGDEAPPAPEPRKADLSEMTALLASKWKGGSIPSSAPKREPARAGQVRQFRIVALDAGRKFIEIELAG